jgi:hypothetical protein
MAWDEVVRTLGSGGTLIAVSIAAYQLVLNRRQARANFEDDLSREYRTISAGLPQDAFYVQVDESVGLTEPQLNAMFRYFDLSNEQLRFCRDRRVSKETAKAWEEGITSNLGLPRFRQAWDQTVPRLSHSHFTQLNVIARAVGLRVAGAPQEIPNHVHVPPRRRSAPGS